MGSTARCGLCGEKIKYSTSQVGQLGEHLLNVHPQNSVTYFKFKNDKNTLSSGSKRSKGSNLPMYKTTVETWRPGLTPLECPSCHKLGQPLIRKQQNKITQSSLGAICLLGCWPLCFLPFILGGSNIMNLYCKYCGEFLGTYDRKTGRLQAPDVEAANIKAPKSCNNCVH